MSISESFDKSQFANGSAICKAYKKDIKDWILLDSTIILLEKLLIEIQLKNNKVEPDYSIESIMDCYSDILEYREEDIFIHPVLRTYLVQWCDKHLARLTDWGKQHYQ